MKVERIMSAKIFKYSFTFVLLILFMSFPVSNLIPEASGKDLENIILVEYLVVYMLVATDVIKESMSMISKGLFFEYNHIALICSIILMCLGKYPDGVIALLLYSISRDFGEYLPKGIKKDIIILENCLVVSFHLK